MGSWSGHTLPGSFFIVFGLAWATKTSYRYFFSNGKARTHKWICCIKFDLVEACCKIIASSFGLIIEQVLPWEPWFHVVDSETQEFTRANNWSHSTMYAFFLLSGIVDILTLKFPKVMPHCIHHIAIALAFAIEGYLFYFHTHGREELDVRLHVLLLFAIWPTSLLYASLAILDNNDNMANSYQPHITKSGRPGGHYRSSSGESSVSLLNEGTGTSNGHVPKYPQEKVLDDRDWTEMDHLTTKPEYRAEDSECDLTKKKIFSIQLSIAVLAILHGTWFWQIATILYPKTGQPWEKDSHTNIAFTTMFFTWHMLAAITIVGTIFTVFALISKRLSLSSARYYALHPNEMP